MTPPIDPVEREAHAADCAISEVGARHGCTCWVGDADVVRVGLGFMLLSNDNEAGHAMAKEALRHLVEKIQRLEEELAAIKAHPMDYALNNIKPGSGLILPMEDDDA